MPPRSRYRTRPWSANWSQIQAKLLALVTIRTVNTFRCPYFKSAHKLGTRWANQVTRFPTEGSAHLKDALALVKCSLPDGSFTNIGTAWWKLTATPRTRKSDSEEHQEPYGGAATHWRTENTNQHKKCANNTKQTRCLCTELRNWERNGQQRRIAGVGRSRGYVYYGGSTSPMLAFMCTYLGANQLIITHIVIETISPGGGGGAGGRGGGTPYDRLYGRLVDFEWVTKTLTTRSEYRKLRLGTNTHSGLTTTPCQEERGVVWLEVHERVPILTQ